ncbi:hypothetical protein Leryth_026290, partial [Lithospermum erythrorhizon]
MVLPGVFPTGLEPYLLKTSARPVTHVSMIQILTRLAPRLSCSLARIVTLGGLVWNLNLTWIDLCPPVASENGSVSGAVRFRGQRFISGCMWVANRGLLTLDLALSEEEAPHRGFHFARGPSGIWSLLIDKTNQHPSTPHRTHHLYHQTTGSYLKNGYSSETKPIGLHVE